MRFGVRVTTTRLCSEGYYKEHGSSMEQQEASGTADKERVRGKTGMHAQVSGLGQLRLAKVKCENVLNSSSPLLTYLLSLTRGSATRKVADLDHSRRPLSPTRAFG